MARLRTAKVSNLAEARARKAAPANDTTPPEPPPCGAVAWPCLEPGCQDCQDKFPCVIQGWIWKRAA